MIKLIEYLQAILKSEIDDTKLKYNDLDDKNSNMAGSYLGKIEGLMFIQDEIDEYLKNLE